MNSPVQDLRISVLEIERIARCIQAQQCRNLPENAMNESIYSGF